MIIELVLGSVKEWHCRETFIRVPHRMKTFIRVLASDFQRREKFFPGVVFSYTVGEVRSRHPPVIHLAIGDRNLGAPLRIDGHLYVFRGDHGLRVAAVWRDARLQLWLRLDEEHVDVELGVALDRSVIDGLNGQSCALGEPGGFHDVIVRMR